MALFIFSSVGGTIQKTLCMSLHGVAATKQVKESTPQNLLNGSSTMPLTMYMSTQGVVACDSPMTVHARPLRAINN